MIMKRYEVLQQLAKGSYSLVLMDCMMPRLDGYATTKMIRECCGGANLHPSILASSSEAISNPNSSFDEAPPRMVSTPPLRGRRPSIATIPHGIPVVAMTGTLSFLFFLFYSHSFSFTNYYFAQPMLCAAIERSAYQ